MRFTCILMLAMLTGCPSRIPTPEEVRLRELPQVRNHRPDVPGNKAVLQLQAETIYLRHDADLTEPWSLVTTEGIAEDRVKLMAANGIRIGTMDGPTLAQFYQKLPPTGGARVQRMGVGREPVIFETTPAMTRAFEIEMLLGFDRDETVRLPAGRMQLILDVMIDDGQVTVGVMPHHHWVTGGITPRTPEDKAMDGRMFKELAVDVDLTGDRFLVMGWLAPAKKNDDKKDNKKDEVTVPVAVDRVAGGSVIGAVPAVPAANVTDTPAPPAAPTTPVTPADVASPPVEPVEPPISPFTNPATKPKLGDVLFTGERSDHPLQMISIIRIPPQDR